MKERIFLFLACLISWGIELALLLTGHIDDEIFNWISPLISCAPALAVLVTKYVIKEPLNMNLWFKPEGRKTGRYVIAGWFGPVVLIAVGALLYFVIFRNQFAPDMSGMIEFQRSQPQQDLSAYTDAQIRQTLWVQIGINIIMAPFYNMFTCIPEEFAWRGYYLNALCEKYSRLRAVLTNGVVWAVWYIPLVAMKTFGAGGYKGNVAEDILYVVGYTLIYSIVYSALYSYLTLKTHSCVPAILANACVASMGSVGRLFLSNPDNIARYVNPTNTSIVGGIGFVAAAVVIYILLAKDRVQPEPMKQEVADMKRMEEMESRAKKKNSSLKKHTQNPYLNNK